MKRIMSFLLVITCLFGLTGCIGYNKIMRNHLSDEKNYISMTAEYSKYEDYDDHMFVLIKSDENIVSANDFDSSETNNDMIRLELIGENYKILKEYFLNNEITSGTQIDIRCSTWIYMDTNFYYIAELKTHDKTYLSFKEGLENIVKHMNSNK